jgi:tetratricopeptide (TPR) repeat protein
LEEVIPVPLSAAPRSGTVWTGIAGLLFALSVGLTLEVTSRFLRIEPDLFGILNLLTQGLLTLLVGSTLFRLGDQIVERTLARWGIDSQLRLSWKAALALTVLILVLIVRFSLPSFARYYNSWGLADQQRGNLTSAITNYQRAISLDPSYAQAHYNLGDAYEDGLEYERALVEYQRALLADPEFYPAYNNLAHLFIVSRSNFAGALTPLNVGLEITPASQDVVRYTLLKNRGWANLELGHWATAEADLRAALTLRPRGAAAHCLLAQTLERSDNPRANAQAARVEWEGCVRYADGDPVKPEASWLALAQEKLR